MDRLMMNGRRIDAIWWSLPFVALILFAAIQVASGVYFYIFMHDLFVPLEGALHLRYGHLPHRDFGSPVGALYFVLHYIPTLVTPLSASTVIYANVLVALLVAAGTMLFARHRFPLWLASITALYLGLTAASPRQIGEPFAVITNNASYNRFSWALIGLLAIVAACPRPDLTRRSSLLDGLAAGILLTALFFIKLTYALAAIGIVVLAIITVRRLSDWRFAAGAFGFLAATVLLVEVSTGLVHLYLADLATAAAVATDVFRPVFAVRLLFYCASGAVAALVVGLIWEWDQPRRLFFWVPRTLLALAIVLAGVAIGIQNHPEFENPLLPVAVLIAGYPSLRFLRRAASLPNVAKDPRAPGSFDAQPPGVRRMAGIACAAGFLGMAAAPMAQDVAGIAWTVVAPRAQGEAIAWIADTPLADLRLFDTGPPPSPRNGAARPINDVYMLELFGDAVSLVRSHIGTRKDAVVLPTTFSNPYPALMGLPPVRHELAWWHLYRTFSLELKPDADKLLSGVDYVLVPKILRDPTSRGFQQAYAAELERDFRQVDENRSWRLLARRNCRARALC
ncbi:hypothetical protein V5740_04675 [Croceibacterium sp. TMG7-5b_MA50]|uniref:hypothetical protein n=1 Tax=Croceibacterium sp. TMG7-5b_MA50 TaxID=3121290 RepID=UPI0032216444